MKIIIQIAGVSRVRKNIIMMGLFYMTGFVMFFFEFSTFIKRFVFPLLCI